MKAYVIKNKEGKYLGVTRDYYSHYWTDNIFDSYHFMPFSESHDIEVEAEEYRDMNYPDCEVVEVTIAEGDLEKDIDYYDYYKDRIEKVDREIKQNYKNYNKLVNDYNILMRALDMACEKWNSNPYFHGEYYAEDYIRLAREELKDE